MFWSWRRLRNGLVTTLTLGGLVLLLARLQPLLPLALAVASVPHLWAERRAAGFKLQAMEGR